MVVNRPCRRPEQLRLFLDRQLTAEEETALVRHLDTCATCQRELELLAADVDDWSDVRDSLREGWPGDAQPAGIEGDDPSGATAGHMPQDDPGDHKLSLDFLAPTDDPAMLGRLGTYEVAGVIGYGGMGIVLKAFDRALSRNVAIKVLAPQLAISASARRRFAREAQAAAAVVHEHVVPIHAVAEARGLPYFVMAYVSGSSLQQRLDRSGPLAVREILRIAMQTAAGLAAAHAQGLVHRDIKPANILLENGVERVMITDFGLARTVDDASLTRSGVIAGTPRYMAPEQAKGDGIDHRADLFSLGSVIYAMCTGRPPFRAETAMAVLRRICEEQPRPIRQINPEIPDWLVEIVEKLHEKDPADRFQTAAEVAGLLGQHLAHLEQPDSVPRPPRLARRPTAGASKRPLWRRPLVAAALLLSMIGVGAIGLVGIGYLGGLFSAAPGPPAARDANRPEGGAAAGLSRSVVAGRAYEGPNEQQWNEEVARIRQQIEQIESGWHQAAEAQPAETWSESLQELRRRLDQLEQDLSQRGM
jgi:serine/threonine protein kinase